MFEYDDVFDKDYRWYILHWDGKTKIKIDLQQLLMKVLYAPPRSGMVCPPEQPASIQFDPLETHEEERRPTNIVIDKEHDLP